MCFSSRQSAKRKLSQYGPEDAVPNAPTTGPLPLREADALGEFSGLDAAESREFALALAGAANDTKAVDISVLDVSRVVSWTRYFVIATCFSRPQVDAAVSRMTGAAEAPPYSRVLAHTPAIGAPLRCDNVHGNRALTICAARHVGVHGLRRCGGARVHARRPRLLRPERLLREGDAGAAAFCVAKGRMSVLRL